QYRALLTEDVTVSPEQAALFGLTTTVERLAGKCLYDPAQRREYQLALYLACLGALKYRNLQHDQKYLLYLTAARQLDLLG
ncbi:MAG: hypothetical protein JW862_12885, partial [Anaerolineales bacterium]|nr:hypothetical protein [Anaerolineales bacterium]